MRSRSRRGVVLALGVALWFTSFVPGPGPSILSSPAGAAGATPIVGRSVLIADQLAAWWDSTGRSHRLHGVTVHELARLFVEEGAAEGVRGDVAFAQTIFETGFFQFSDAVPPHFHNYAGIGAPNNTAEFPDARTGVRAQIQHLRAYGDPTVGETGTARPLVDPRFDLVNPKGVAPTFEELGGRWSSGPDYGRKVVAIFERILDHAGPTLRDRALASPVRSVGTSDAGGVWLADAAGGVFSLGTRFFGSIPARRASGVPIGPAPLTAMAVTPAGDGYWLVDDTGGVHTFGQARYHGSIPQRRASGIPVGPARVVDVVADPLGRGYWLVDAFGGVHAFGAVPYFGSVPARRAAGMPIGSVPVVAMAVTPAGDGYWLVDESGGVHAFGRARYRGSVPALRAAGIDVGRSRIVDLVADPASRGYWLVDESGGVFAMGAPYRGSAAGSGLRFVAGVALPDGAGYRLASDDGGVIAYQ